MKDYSKDHAVGAVLYMQRCTVAYLIFFSHHLDQITTASFIHYHSIDNRSPFN